jgi:hypothetical protein
MERARVWSAIVLRVATAFDRALGVFAPRRTIVRYFELREDILKFMPWTNGNLHPVINPYLHGSVLPGNGYVAAMLQTKYFVLVIHRQVLSEGNDHIVSIASPCFPGEYFPFGVTETAVLKLEGIKHAVGHRYDSLPDLDASIQRISLHLQRHLSCENFPATRTAIENLLNEAMRQVTEPGRVAQV